MSRMVKTTCLDCGTEITLDFGDHTYEEALKLIDKMDNMNRECPGFHVEFGGWKRRWQLDKAVEEAYSEEEKNQSNVVWSLLVSVENEQRQFTGLNHEEEAVRYLQEQKAQALEDNRDIENIEVTITELTRDGRVLQEEKSFLKWY